jgi:hypothetical protein
LKSKNNNKITTLRNKNKNKNTQIGLEAWLKKEALSPNPRTIETNEQNHGLP